MQEGEDQAASSADAGAGADDSPENRAASSDSSSQTAEEPARGELLIQGPNLFSEYWRRPDATAEAFTADGFFRSGDTASAESLPGPGGSPLPYWRILGRTSVDILKSAGDCVPGCARSAVRTRTAGAWLTFGSFVCAGYKISALDVENALLAHPAVREVAVVGIPDERLGQKVLPPCPLWLSSVGHACIRGRRLCQRTVALRHTWMHIYDTLCASQLGAVLATSEEISEADLLHWAREELPAYQVCGLTCSLRVRHIHLLASDCAQNTVHLGLSAIAFH